MLDLRPLHSPGFRHLAAACWFNEFGNWIGEIALAVLVYDRTHSPLATAVLFVSLRFLPALIAPLLTTRVESMPPRVVIGVLFLLEAIVFIVIAAISVHSFSFPLVLALVGVDGVCAIAATALVRTALATGLTRDDLLREGNALINLGVMVAIAGAPALAGVVIAADGPAAGLRIDAATFAAAGLIILTARHLELESDSEAGFRGRLRAGLSTLRTRPNISRLIVAIALVIGFGSVALPIEVVFAKSTLHVGDSGYGLLLTSWGAGMLVGGLWFAISTELRLMIVLGISTSLEALGYGGLALSPTLAIACAFSFVGGIGNSAAWVAARTALQARIPLNRQAAIMSVLEGANQVMPALGFIAGGAVTALTSPRAAYAISAVGIAAVVLFFTIRPIDRVQLSVVAEVQGDSADETDKGLSISPQETEASQRMTPRPTVTRG